ncbi:MAG: hypothetical protein UDB11_10720 [Peptococcaceae bacterium]|nr:hypothetical protein [Peptococcaceae bacterium]
MEMKQNEKFSYDDDAVLIMDEAVAAQDYTTVQKAVTGALAVISAAMVVTFFKSAKARRLAKKQAKKLARFHR